MKTFLLFFTFLLISTGCSNNNAFDLFKMDKDQERSITSLETAKILTIDGAVSGVFSSIYLNEVYPDSFNDGENFFVYIYLKKEEKMYDPKKLVKTNLNIKLNGKLAVKLKELPRENKFSHLVSIKSNWNKYYLVTFLTDKKRDLSLNLEIESDPSSSAVLNYQKAEQ